MNTTKSDVLISVVDYADYRFGNGVHSYHKGDSIPVSGAVIDSSDILAVVSASLDGWFTDGKYCATFREWLKKYLGVRHAVLSNSGSSANLLALTAMAETYGHKGGKVVTSATGFPTTVSSIIQAGYVPLFVDADADTLNANMAQVRYALQRDDVVGIIQAHTLGFPYNSKAVQEWCDEDGKFQIEDACDALGASIDGKMVGSFGDASTLSFFPAHHITSGEGGCVLTNSGSLYQVIESLCNWGRACWCKPGESDTCGKRFNQNDYCLPSGWDHKYTFARLGYNLKMTELQASLGTSQVARINEFVQTRKKNFDILYKGLRSYKGFLDLVLVDFRCEPSPFGFPITVPPSSPFTRGELVSYLEAHSVHTRPVFGGNLTRQPAFRKEHFETFEPNLWGSNYIMDYTFWIGCHPGLTQEHLDYVLEVFQGFFKEKGIS